MDQAIRLLFSHAAASPEEVKQAEAHLTAFETSPEFWNQATQMLSISEDVQVQSYLLMAMKRRILSEHKTFTSTQKRSLLEFVKNLSIKLPMRDQLLARMWALFWGILTEEEKMGVFGNLSIFYYFLEEDLDTRVISWMSPVVKEHLFPQLLAVAPNTERCGIIKLLVEKEISTLDSSQVESLLAMAVQSHYPEELFDVLEMLLEKYAPATFLPFIKFFLFSDEPPEVEFVLFCMQWLEYASDVHNAPVYVKILELACEHYDPADPCFSPQFLLEVSQLPAPLPLELEEAIVISVSQMLHRITECRDIESERKEGDLSILRSALQPFSKLNYFEHYLKLGDALMTEAIAAHLPAISVFTLKNVLECSVLGAKDRMRIANRLLRHLSEADLELLKEFAMKALTEYPVMSLKLLKHMARSTKIDFTSLYPLVSASGDRRLFKVYVTCLEEYNRSVMEYILQLKDEELLGSYVDNLKHLPLDNLMLSVLMGKVYQQVHSRVIDRLDVSSQNKLLESVSNEQPNIVLLAELGTKRKDLQPIILSHIMNQQVIDIDTIKSLLPCLRSFEGSDFVTPILPKCDVSDPEILQLVVKLLKTKSVYSVASFTAHCLALPLLDSFTDAQVASYLFNSYLQDPSQFLQLLSTHKHLHVKADTFKGENNFIEWWLRRGA